MKIELKNFDMMKLVNRLAHGLHNHSQLQAHVERDCENVSRFIQYGLHARIGDIAAIEVSVAPDTALEALLMAEWDKVHKLWTIDIPVSAVELPRWDVFKLTVAMRIMPTRIEYKGETYDVTEVTTLHVATDKSTGSTLVDYPEFVTLEALRHIYTTQLPYPVPSNPARVSLALTNAIATIRKGYADGRFYRVVAEEK